jgi:hypothetical protein
MAIEKFDEWIEGLVKFYLKTRTAIDYDAEMERDRESFT